MARDTSDEWEAKRNGHCAEQGPSFPGVTVGDTFTNPEPSLLGLLVIHLFWQRPPRTGKGPRFEHLRHAAHDRVLSTVYIHHRTNQPPPRHDAMATSTTSA